MKGIICRGYERDGYSAGLILSRDRRVEPVEVIPVPVTKLHNVTWISKQIVRRARQNGEVL